MQFNDDPCAIKYYIKIRLSNSDLETNSTNLKIHPTNYALLLKAKPTFAAVERSFSMLSKLLNKDRNFEVKNVIYDVAAAFVKNNIDRLLVYSIVAITMHFLYYTLIDTSTYNNLLS